jgi:hypothetical protein
MKKCTLFLLLTLLCSACSYLSRTKKVECCEKKAKCCYAEMCCLPRYAKAAGVEPKSFTPEVPVYGTAQDLEPPPGPPPEKPSFFSHLNPFGGSGEEQNPQGQSSATKEPPPEHREEGGFFSKLWPF